MDKPVPYEFNQITEKNLRFTDNGSFNHFLDCLSSPRRPAIFVSSPRFLGRFLSVYRFPFGCPICPRIDKFSPDYTTAITLFDPSSK
jgi:hypothetical protein